MKYKISIEVKNATMFATIMDLVEKNPEVVVLEAGIDKSAPIKHKRAPQNRSFTVPFEQRYYSYLLGLPSVKNNLADNHKIEVTSNDAMAWCAANNYARSSATSLTSIMVKRGMLAKTETRGIFRLMKPDTTIQGPNHSSS